MRFLIMIFLATVAMVNQAYAGWIQFGDQSLPCSSDYTAVSAKELYTATVLDNGSGKLHFVKNPAKDEQCASDAKLCREDAYLVPGDRVIVSSGTGDLSCVTYVSPKGTRKTGLLPANCLDFETNNFAKFDSDEMMGDWVQDNAFITLTKTDNGFILIEGDATLGVGSTRMGSISGVAFFGPEGMTAGYDDSHYSGEEAASDTPKPSDGCRVRLRSLTHFLVVDDNDSCGGQGVTFSGIYTKGKVTSPRE